ncbi:MAG: zinc-ribbon domain-containing protein [Anaerolineaceae bacterium]|nr:zinc-ribbon domain-containing protein [Anaerolineaceae bacterium]
MITCPNCQTQNESGSRFCISCGHDLSNEAAGGGTAVAHTGFYRRRLGVSIGQTVIALLLVWLLRSVFVNLSFVEGLTLPDVPFTVAQIITFIVYLIAFFLLVNFVNTLRSHWPNAYPRLAALTPALTVVIYVMLISLAYRALLPVIIDLADDPSDFVLVLRVILTVLALALLGWAGKVIYDALPGWLAGIRLGATQGESGEVACLNCGRLNTAAMHFCGHCGHELTTQEVTKPENES